MEKVGKRRLSKQDKAMLRFNPDMIKAIRQDSLDEPSRRWLEGSITDSFYVRYQN